MRLTCRAIVAMMQQVTLGVMDGVCQADLTFYYDGSFDNVFENVSFSIDTNWKLGFIGRNDV